MPVGRGAGVPGWRRRWMTALLRRSVRGSVQGGLAGVWVRGDWPAGGAVIAPNHHSWWDGYLLAVLAWRRGQTFRVMMNDRQLSRFPFLTLIGAVDTAALRPLVRDVQRGAWAVVFPEGAIRPAGAPAALQPGAAWLARASGRPLVPVALRVVVRGAQWPEAYVRVGTPCGPADLADRLRHEVAALDEELRHSDPDVPLPGYVPGVQGRGSVHDRVSWPARLLSRMAGFPGGPEGP